MGVSGIAVIQQGGQLWFSLEGLQSQLRVNFLQNMSLQRNFRKLISRQVILWHFPMADHWSHTALSEVLCSTWERTVRQHENISIQLKHIFLFFTAAWNCLGWLFKQFQSWGHSRHVQSFTPYSCTPTLSLWGGGAPLSLGVCGEGTIPKTCRSTTGYVLVGTKSFMFSFLSGCRFLERETDP